MCLENRFIQCTMTTVHFYSREHKIVYENPVPTVARYSKCVNYTQTYASEYMCAYVPSAYLFPNKYAIVGHFL